MKNGNGNGHHVKEGRVSVSPAVAQRWLSMNLNNRALRPTHVEALARDMREGRWLYNGDPIRFDKNGDLIDGQHRLHAVILSGKTIDFLVVRGLESRVQETIDIGSKRTAADALRLRGITNSNETAAIVRKFILWETGKRWHFSNFKVTSPQVTELMDADPDFHVAAEKAVRYRNTIPVPPSVIGFTWLIFSKIDREVAEQFFEQLGTGADLSNGHPVLTLRNRLVGLRNESGRIKDERLIGTICRAWNAHREGRKLHRLQVETESDVFPEPV
jgi:hypothetical protein